MTKALITTKEIEGRIRITVAEASIEKTIIVYQRAANRQSKIEYRGGQRSGHAAGGMLLIS
jgi:hypothetical protein